MIGSTNPNRSTNILKVLVVDDNHNLLTLMARVLEERGFHVVQATDGDTGRELLENEGYDLLLADIYMPGMSGLELLEHAHVLNEDMRVILMSSASFNEVRQAAARLGASAFLPKPFSPAELVSAVDRVFREGVTPRAASHHPD